MAKTIGCVLSLKDKFSTTLKDIANKLGITEKELKKATLTVKNFQKQASSGFKTVGLGAVGMGSALAGAVGVAVNTTLGYAKEVKRMQTLTGESVESASKMVAVGKKYGISADGMAKSLRMLSIKATNNCKDFKTYGLVVKNAHGELLPASKILEQVADKYKQLGGGLKGAVFAQKLMGKGCMDLLPLLKKGSVGIQAMEADASRMGLVLSKDNMDSFSKFSEAQKRFNQAMLGIQVTIGAKILPILGQLAEKVNVAITKFDFRQVGTVTDKVFKGIGSAVKFVGNNINWLIPITTAVLSSIIAFKTISTTINVFSTLNGVIKALTITQGIWNAVMLANPIGLVAVGIGLLIGVGVLLVMNWKTICKWAGRLMGWINKNKLAFVLVTGPIGLLVLAGIKLYENWGKICKKASELWGWLKKITGFGNKTISVNANINRNSPGENKVPHHSLGTSYFKGGSTYINEGGRGEKITLPSGSKITPHNETKKALNNHGAVNLHIEIHGNVIGEKEFLNKMGAMFTDKVVLALGNI